uniref:uncharacterized protein LOC105349553 n=1 Tax=Fragaria vesca subsp. vesca TaxID=101020 RepID=UPI0005C83124|nr:PREDICTED: uncharacterized protein LOC105349553 [Fragaria vesca subsp. vesca]
MAILFSPSLISSGELQVHDNVRHEDDSVPRDEQLAPGQLEERQSDARRKDKGKGEGCFKCGALNHIAKECTGDSVKKQKPHKYMLKNARHEMVLYGDTPESRRQRRRDQENKHLSHSVKGRYKGESSRHGRSSQFGGRGRERDTEDRLHQRFPFFTFFLISRFLHVASIFPRLCIPIMLCIFFRNSSALFSKGLPLAALLFPCSPSLLLSVVLSP